MKTIGFIDYFLSEWHANNYPAWIAKLCEETGSDYRVAYAWAEIDTSPYDGVTTDAWCEKHGVKKCGSIAEVCNKSDFIIILSPDNPETHLKYAKAVLQYGKPVYIDKTFAPDLATAEKIFACAEQSGTPMFTASALGFADELKKFDAPVRSVITTGGGTALERYCIHQLEMIVSLMGKGAKRVMSLSAGGAASVCIDYGEGRTAVLNYSQAAEYGFSINVEGSAGEAPKYLPIASDFFRNLMKAILELFDMGKPAFSKAHTLEVMAVRDALLKSQKTAQKWFKISKVNGNA